MKMVLSFPDLKNLHLKKDVGLVPYYLSKIAKYDADILYGDRNEYMKDASLLGDVRLIPLSGVWFFRMLMYLFRNARSIDVFMQFHGNPQQLILGRVYKWMNRTGIAYIKGDFCETVLDMNKPGCLNFLRRVKIKEILRVVDLLSIERQDVFEFLSNEFKSRNAQLLHLPNGFDDLAVGEDVVPFEKKANRMITVGRLGAKQKATEIFLEAISTLKEELEGWEVLLVGPIEEPFKETVKAFFADHPDLENKVRLVGSVEERNDVFQFYRDSKIFCLTSRWESWGLVLHEAAFFGNAIVSTKVGGSVEITGGGRYGRLCEIDDVKGIADALRYWMRNPAELEWTCKATQEYARANFSWSVLIKRLDDKLRELLWHKRKVSGNGSAACGGETEAKHDRRTPETC